MCMYMYMIYMYILGSAFKSPIKYTFLLNSTQVGRGLAYSSNDLFLEIWRHGLL